MEKIFEAIIKLLPCSLLFERLGLSRETSAALAGVITVIAVYALHTLYKYLVEHYKNSNAASDLAPYFDSLKVKSAREFYIPTQFQNQSPTHEEEPQFTHKFVSKSPLIPFFMNTAFNEKKENDKFYLILADSGMGKTTFMINLYVQYTSFFNFGRKYKIRLYPFGDARILQQIKQIKQIKHEEARKTILLLDAFDEDKKLIPPEEPDGLSDDERFRQRLDEVIETVRDFREVVITCRSQYFPGLEDKPYELKIPRFDDKGFHTLAKLYLSPFDDKEIKRYLNKKYGLLRFWNRKKKKSARTIVKNSPKLMVRPMLLSYIDYLVESRKVFTSTWEIYETLIDEWVKREARKRKYETCDRETFEQNLHEYSRLVAIEIFRQRKENKLLNLEKDSALEVACRHNINLRDYEITGQSLLTCDAEQNWKFAHKSIYEFLIAREAVSNLSFMKKVDFAGMDMAQRFYNEKIPPGFVFIKGGTFLMGSPDNEVDRRDDETQHQVKVNDFCMSKHTVTVADFEIFIAEYKSQREKTNINLQKDKQHPVTNVSWNDAVEYCKWMSKKLNAVFRLPTEAEWEYACRAGGTKPFNTGDNLTTDQANYNGNYPYANYPKGKFLGNTTPVGSYLPNAWGLYDMHGNVFEWCQDWYGEKYYDECKSQGVVDNPKGPDTGSDRVLRGGSWNRHGRRCRCADRFLVNPAIRRNDIGFRLVFVP